MIKIRLNNGYLKMNDRLYKDFTFKSNYNIDTVKKAFHKAVVDFNIFKEISEYENESGSIHFYENPSNILDIDYDDYEADGDGCYFIYYPDKILELYIKLIEHGLPDVELELVEESEEFAFQSINDITLGIVDDVHSCKKAL